MLEFDDVLAQNERSRAKNQSSSIKFDLQKCKDKAFAKDKGNIEINKQIQTNNQKKSEASESAVTGIF